MTTSESDVDKIEVGKSKRKRIPNPNKIKKKRWFDMEKMLKQHKRSHAEKQLEKYTTYLDFLFTLKPDMPHNMYRTVGGEIVRVKNRMDKLRHVLRDLRVSYGKIVEQSDNSSINTEETDNMSLTDLSQITDLNSLTEITEGDQEVEFDVTDDEATA